jgi:prepilin-type N-terminal cleavage/methylation domain-containing protein
MPLPQRGSPSSLAMRPAFTLVELLVAIVVFTIGLVALAATSGLVAAHVGDGGRLTAAAHAARTVLDSLGARGCNAIVSGSATRDGIAVEWVVSRDSSAAEVALTVGTVLRRRSRRDGYQLVVPCVRD